MSKPNVPIQPVNENFHRLHLHAHNIILEIYSEIDKISEMDSDDV